MKKVKILLLVRKIKSDFKIIYTFFKEAYSLFLKLLKHNASSPFKKTPEKLQFLILRETHVVEKGMSMKNPKIGFGQERIQKLLESFLDYTKVRNDDFLIYPLSTVKKYIDYTKSNHVNIEKIENLYARILTQMQSFDNYLEAGIKNVTKEDIWMRSKINFKEFVNCRHSIRYFSPDEIPDTALIYEALEIAQRTPSACNRQAWRVYVFGKENTLKLLTWQGGARGFENEIPMSILVTADLNGFLFYEPYQAYVDGGMYSMSLIYALHSLGLGTIPLSTGFKSNKLKELYQKFNLPKNEIPVVIVGLGCLKEKFNVAVSHRNPIHKFVKLHL